MTKSEQRDYILGKGWTQGEGDSTRAVWKDPKGETGPQTLETAFQMQVKRDGKAPKPQETAPETSTEEVSEDSSEDKADKKKKRR